MQSLRGQRLTAHGHKKAVTLCLAFLFFASQIFSCCLVNEKIGRFINSTFTALASENFPEPSVHACCPKTNNENNQASDQKGCCIQLANQKPPVMPSEASVLPEMPDFVIGILPVAKMEVPAFLIRPNFRDSSDPPLYLTQLKLLI